jgi:phage-related protein
MAVEDLPDDQLQARMEWIEGLIHGANVKDLPYLIELFNKLLNEQVRRDLEFYHQPEKA